MLTEDLILEKLQHAGSQGLGNTVNLIQEEDSFPDIRLLHQLIDGPDNFAHGILGQLILHPLEFISADEGETQGTLPGMVGHGIGNQTHAQLRGDLLHNGCLSDSGRSHQEDRPLLLHRNLIIAKLILGKVGGHGILDLFLCFCYIHGVTFLSYKLYISNRFISAR